MRTETTDRHLRVISMLKSNNAWKKATLKMSPHGDSQRFAPSASNIELYCLEVEGKRKINVCFLQHVQSIFEVQRKTRQDLKDFFD
jgi:hypothetical protein